MGVRREVKTGRFDTLGREVSVSGGSLVNSGARMSAVGDSGKVGDRWRADTYATDIPLSGATVKVLDRLLDSGVVRCSGIPLY